MTDSQLGGRTFEMLIGGRLTAAISGAEYDDIDPATEGVIGRAPDAGPLDMEAAIGAARVAFDETEWSTNHKLRARVLRQLGAGLEKMKEEFRPDFIRETGIPLRITPGLFDAPIANLEFFADMAESFQYEQELTSVELLGSKHRRMVWREPFGVVGVITPWNSPFQLSLMKLAPVLAAGNTAVLKPAPDTPWSGLIIGLAAAQCTDMPDGVLNVVSSSANEVGDVLTGHSAVDGVTFTGSTAVGRQVAARGAATVKKVALELGGKSACIALESADIVGISQTTAQGVCWRAGQGCALITRLLVPRSRADEAVLATSAAMESFPNGSPFESDTFIGPLINRRQYDRVLGYIQSGIDEGSRLVTGGGRAPNHDKGFYVAPTLFADVDPGSRIAKEEIFGPVLVISPYDTLDEAVNIANSTDYGLSAAVVGGSTDEALAVARRLRAGTCGVNGGVWFGVDVPFGGYKQSGIGRENGTWGFAEFLETKAVAVPEAV